MSAVAVLAVAVVALLLLLVWGGQRSLIYYPMGGTPAPDTALLPGLERVSIRAEDGAMLQAWFVPSAARPAWFTVIVFNGNAGNRAYRAPLAAALRSAGISVLLFDYRGFGDSSGSPTETGLAADARAVRAYVEGRSDVRRDRLAYFGESLGSGVAVSLALSHPPAALILRSPFTSLVEVGRFHFPVLPVRWLLRDRFNSIDAIDRLRTPILVIAGDRDTIVPFEQSRRLYDKATAAKRLVVVAGADHNDLELLEGAQMIDAIRVFLEEQSR